MRRRRSSDDLRLRPSRTDDGGRRVPTSGRDGSLPGWRITVVRGRVPAPDGTEFEPGRRAPPGAVAVVPVTDDGARPPGPPVPGRRRPASCSRSRPAPVTSTGEPPEETARARAGRGGRRSAPRHDAPRSAPCSTAPGFCDEETVRSTWPPGCGACPPTATGVEERAHDGGVVASTDVDALVAAGELVDGQTILGLLLARPRARLSPGLAGRARRRGEGRGAIGSDRRPPVSGCRSKAPRSTSPGWRSSRAGPATPSSPTGATSSPTRRSWPARAAAWTTPTRGCVEDYVARPARRRLGARVGGPGPGGGARPAPLPAGGGVGDHRPDRRRAAAPGAAAPAEGARPRTRSTAARRGDRPTTRRPVGDRAILEVLYGTGMRISELVGLSLGRPRLRHRAGPGARQGLKERLVPLGRCAAEALERLARARRAGPRWCRAGGPGGATPRPCSSTPGAGGSPARGSGASCREAGPGGRAARTGSARTCCATPARPTCSTTGPTSGWSRSCSDTSSIATTQIYTKVSPEHLRDGL